MRRYTFARNAIDRIRALGEADAIEPVPAGEGPGFARHPLPTTTREAPAGYFRPLPNLPGRPLWNPTLPSDSGAVNYAARQRGQLDDVPKGSPDEPVLVVPNWESRLVNMTDFLGVLQLGVEGATPTPATFQLSSYTVPQGYTAIWKEFQLLADPLPAIMTQSNTLITLLVDDGPVPNFVNLPLGAVMSVPQKTFAIIGEGRRISAQVRVLTGGPVPGGFTLTCLAYGNLRLSPGQSLARSVGVAPPTQPAAAPAPPSAPASPRLEFGITQVLSSKPGRGGTWVAVRDAARASLPGGFRPFTRGEYQANRAAVDRFVADNRRFAPNLRPLIE